MSDELERLKQHQTDHLILLVGTNPLPNYVAAQLLVRPGGTVHLLCSGDTEEIAKRLAGKLSQLSLQTQPHPNLNEGHPADIYQKVCVLAESLKNKGKLGLHYTGGTKAMSVHTYRAVKQVKPDAVCSYLDARTLQIVVDGGMGDGRDDYAKVGQVVRLTVKEILDLHQIELQGFKSIPVRLDVARAIKTTIESPQGDNWRNWLHHNRIATDGFDKKKGDEIKAIKTPLISEFPFVCEAFAKLGSPDSGTFGDWASAIGFKTGKGDMPKFAKWLEGEWLESIVLQSLLDIKDEGHLFDCGMDYKVEESKFQFDVAAMRGYQLFAFSCTMSRDVDMCKSKLFEAHTRARQMGGDEARAALVCYYRDPQALLTKFKSENYFAEGSVKVFGEEDLKDLAANLQHWIQSN